MGMILLSMGGTFWRAKSYVFALLFATLAAFGFPSIREGVKGYFSTTSQAAEVRKATAEIVSPLSKDQQPRTVLVEGPFRNLPADRKLMMEIQSEEHIFYWEVSTQGDRFSRETRLGNKEYEGVQDPDKGKKFILQMVTMPKSQQVDKKPYDTALPCERISAPATFWRRALKPGEE